MKSKFEAICPYCEKTQRDNSHLKTWTMHNAEVFRYSCECGKYFSFYLGKDSNWTIPKSNRKLDEKFRYFKT